MLAAAIFVFRGLGLYWSKKSCQEFFLATLDIAVDSNSVNLKFNW
jgi:hypothetical protein